MALTISTEPLEPRQLLLRVQVEQERVDQELRKAARKVAGNYRIPGFRPGKAPYNMLVQYVGLPALFNEFIEPLGQELYPQALEQAQIEPYAPAQLDIDSLEPLTYKFVVPLEPEIDLGDYRSLRVEPPVVEVSDDDVAQELQTYLDEYATRGEVDRPSEYGDLLTIDVKSVIAADADAGTDAVVVLDETDWDVTPDQENPMDPPGFDEALVGVRPGEEKEFVLSWPAESQSVHAGKQATFTVKLHKITGTSTPALDDTFAQMIGPEFQTLDDLKANIRTTLSERAQADAENEYLDKALDALSAQSTMVYPPAVVEDQIDVMVNQLERQLREYGIENLESYLQQVGRQTLEQYRDALRPQAEIMARRNLLISEIYRREGLTVTDEDLDARIDRMLGDAGAETSEVKQSLRDMMRSGSGRAILESQILQEKSLQRLLAIVRGEELPPLPTPETASAAAEGEAAPAESATPAESAAPAESATEGGEAAS